MDELPHELIISENQIEIKSLPVDLRKQINGLNLTLRQKSITENTRNGIMRRSEIIRNKIYTFLNPGLLEKEDPQIIQLPMKTEETEKEKSPESTEEKKAEIPATPAPAEPVKKDPVNDTELEEKVKSKLVKGKISERDLQAILGKKPHWSTQLVGSLKLVKIIFSDDYKLS